MIPRSVKYAIYAAIAIHFLRKIIRKVTPAAPGKPDAYDPVDLFLHVGDNRSYFASCDSTASTKRFIDALLSELPRDFRGMRVWIETARDVDNDTDFNRNGVRFSRLYPKDLDDAISIVAVHRINLAVERAANR